MLYIELSAPWQYAPLPPHLGAGDQKRGQTLGAFSFLEPESNIVPGAAILIDGGYFLKRLPAVRPDVDTSDADAVAISVKQLVQGHLQQLNEVYASANPFALLYRTFYYDARPYKGKDHTPVDRRSIDWSRTNQAVFRTQLFDALRSLPNVAVRLGDVRRDSNHAWILQERARKDILKGHREAADLSDSDFSPALRQKGVDMRIGLDIALIALKYQADIIILVSGDSDFVPAAKLARREGVQFILDPLWQKIPSDLSEHIDGLRSGFYRSQHKEKPTDRD